MNLNVGGCVQTSGAFYVCLPGGREVQALKLKLASAPIACCYACETGQAHHQTASISSTNVRFLTFFGDVMSRICAAQMAVYSYVLNSLFTTTYT